MNKKHTIFLSILAVVIFVLGVYAAKAEPISIQIGSTTISFLPLVIKSQAAEPPSGVLYIFPSTETTDGYAAGRSGINRICPNEDPDSHFCSLQEIENASGTIGVYFENPFPDTWVDNLNTWGSFEENCYGWVNNTTTSGQYIAAAARDEGTTTCDNTFPVACCKLIP